MNIEMCWIWVIGSMLMGVGLGASIGVLSIAHGISAKKIHIGCRIIIIVGFLMGYWAIKNLGI